MVYKTRKREKQITMHLFFLLLMLFFAASTVNGTEAEHLYAGDRLFLSPAGYGGGGRFTSIAVSPFNPNVVLIGSDVAGVFKSQDGGESFRLAGTGLEGFAVADIAFHPVVQQKVFLLTDYGFYASADNGESWGKKSSTVHYGSRFSGSHLMIFFRDCLWVATDRKGVFKVSLSTPGLSAEPVPGLEILKVNGLAIYQDTVHAATSNGVYRYNQGKWNEWNHGLKPLHREIVDIVAHPKGRLYLVEKTAGLHIWDASDKQWKSRPVSSDVLFTRPKYSPRAYKALAIHPKNPDQVFLATHPKTWPPLLFASRNGGASWEMIEDFMLAPQAADFWARTIKKSITAIEEIGFVSQHPLRLFMTDWWSVWKSQDGGKKWSQVHKGLQNICINDVKTHPQDPQKIFLAAFDNGLMASGDAGKTWNRIMSGVVDGHAVEVEISRTNPSRMYLLMNPWKSFDKGDKIFVYKTTDSGSSWQEISFAVSKKSLPRLDYVDGLATNLEMDPLSDDTVYVATNGFGIFKTVNAGRDWKPVNLGLTTPYIKGPDALLIQHRNPKVIFASTLAGGIHKSTDAGESWRLVCKISTFPFGMAIDPFNPSRILACAAEKKVLLSEDEGQSWRAIQLPGRAPIHIAAYAAAFHPLHPRVVFVGTLAYAAKVADGLFVSRDGGHSFEKCPLRLPSVSINDIEIARAAELGILIGFNGIGVFRGEIKEHFKK